MVYFSRTKPRLKEKILKEKEEKQKKGKNRRRGENRNKRRRTGNESDQSDDTIILENNITEKGEEKLQTVHLDDDVPKLKRSSPCR